MAGRVRPLDRDHGRGPALTLSPATRLGPYEIVAPLGAGGMGEVYRARDSRLGREVAIKVLPAEVASDPDRLRRFEQEARAASALNHPGILTVHDFGSEAGVAYLVTELLDGESLRDALRRGPLPARRAVEIALQLAKALAAAHDKGIVHRDLKPENLFLVRDGHAKVLDFGLARIDRPERSAAALHDASTLLETRAGTVLGTAGYMAPEQVRGERADARSDLFSLGVVLHEMLTGACPFLRDSVVESLHAILKETPLEIASTTPGASPALSRVVGRLLEKDPERRFHSAHDLVFALEGVDEAAGALRASAARPAPAAAGSRRAAFALGATALLVVAALLVWRSGGDDGAAGGVRSLAVLPLRELGAPGDAVLGLGVADTLGIKLSRVEGLVVRPGSSVREAAAKSADPQACGRSLAVDAVLDGTVQRAAGMLRFNLSMIAVADGRTLWAETVDAPEEELFALQDRIASAVLVSLRPRLSPSASLPAITTSHAAAYEEYLRALPHLDRRQSSPDAAPRALEHLTRAVELDPGFARAWAQRALAETWLGLFLEPDRPEWIALAREHEARARALDPTLAEPYVVRGELAWSAHEGFDLERATREFLAARERDPNAAHADLGIFYAHFGFAEPALAALRRALELDPTSRVVQERYLESLSLLLRHAEARRESERLGLPLAPYSLSRIVEDDPAELLREADTVLAARPAALYTRLARAVALARLGRHAEALDEVEAVIPQLPERNRAHHHATHQVACVFALAGRTADAVVWLERTAALGLPNLPLFEHDPNLGPIRPSSEYRAFLESWRPRWERWRRELGGGRDA